MADIASLLAKNIKRLRELNEFTQDELAEKMNVSRTAIQAYEGCRRWPEKPYLEAMARALKVEPTELFKPDDPETSNDIESLLDLLSYWAKASDSTKDSVMVILKGMSSRESKVRRRS